jgi:hypothetical protein
MKTPTEFDLLVRETILSCDGFVLRAAKALGVPVGSLYYNLSTVRQRDWWRITRERLFSKKVRSQKRSRRYYVRKRMAMAAQGALGAEGGGSNGSDPSA